jgi:hypothetical protein
MTINLDERQVDILESLVTRELIEMECRMADEEYRRTCGDRIKQECEEDRENHPKLLDIKKQLEKEGTNNE